MKIIRNLLLFFFCLTVFLSCKTRRPSNEIRLMIWGDANELTTVQSFVRQFEKIKPDIKVRVICINPTDYNAYLQSLFLNKDAPDVLYVSREWLQYYASRGMFKDLSSLISTDKDFDFQDFYPQVKNSFFYNGHPYAVGKDFTPLVLYYNEDLFKKAGVAFPRKNWTWDDFLSTAKQLTRDVNGDGQTDQYGFIVERWLGWVLPWIYQENGALLDDQEKISRVGIEPYLNGNIRALQFLYDLIYREKVAPDLRTTDREGTIPLFSEGKAAMCVYGRWVCLNFRQIKDFKWNVAPLPKAKNDSTILLTVGYAISNRTTHLDESWALLKFLTGKEVQQKVAVSGLAVPARKSVAESTDFLKSPLLPEDINHRVFLENLDHAPFPPSTTEWHQMEEEFNIAMDLIFRQNKPIRDVLIRYHKRLDIVFR